MALALSDIATTLNTLFGVSAYNSTNLLQRPDLIDIGMLIKSLSTTPTLTSIATAYNNLLGTSITASDLNKRPDMLYRGLLILAAGGT